MSDKPVSATKKPKSALREFLDSETSGGALLMIAAAIALIVSNSPLSIHYFRLLDTQLGPMTFHMIVNDFLMALFFLLVGLEIKREFTDGQLSSWEQRRLPILAAACGMIVPALIYLIGISPAWNLSPGWAIPCATDIAFALAILALAGPQVPFSLKLFLTTVAIVDDMGAVAIIAIGYTRSIDGAALLGALVVFALLYAMNRWKIGWISIYLLGFGLMWWFVLRSGVHPTIAGVLTAATVPLRPTPAAPDAEDSTLHRLQRFLDRPVAWIVLPLFGFANAGIEFGAGEVSVALAGSIALGLFLGKQIGIFGSIYLAVKLGWAKRPMGASWTHIYGVSLLCGIGFTMSLFIGELAFTDKSLRDSVRIGVLAGSLISALAGLLVLRSATQKPQ
jgi:Na+:H+ antiporter, NhaA family